MTMGEARPKFRELQKHRRQDDDGHETAQPDYSLYALQRQSVTCTLLARHPSNIAAQATDPSTPRRAQ